MTPRRSRTRTYAAVAALGVVLWGLGFWAYVFFSDRGDRRDVECFNSAANASARVEATASPIPLGSTSSVLSIAVGQNRGTARDQIELQAATDIPRRLRVGTSSLVGEGETIPRAFVHARAVNLRNSLVIDACVDGREVPLHPGEYAGSVVITDERVTPLSVPLEVTVQARYLWLLAPLAIVFPLLGLYLVWQSVTSADHRASFGRGAIVTLIAGVGATGATFGASGLQNPSWGGPIDFFALLATLYTAATAVTATLGGAAGQVEKDNPGNV